MMKEVKEILKKEGLLKDVVERLQKKGKEIKWGEVKEDDREDSLSYRILGSLGTTIRVNLVAIFNWTETEGKWAGTYTSVLHFDVLEKLEQTTTSIYQRVAHTHKDVVLVFTTEKLKNMDEEKLPTKEEFLTLTFQKGLTDFLVHGLEEFVPTKGEEEFSEELENYLSCSETMYYQIKEKE